jgi:hypothetical protein
MGPPPKTTTASPDLGAIHVVRGDGEGLDKAA